MPSSVLMEEDRAFGNREPTSANGFHDDSQREQARLHPIRTQDMNHGDDFNHRTDHEPTSANPILLPTASTQDLVARIILHEDRPIENLPAMVSPELKLIGRCVTFLVKRTLNAAPTTSYFYVGLVSTITASTVSLMYVSRYTPADFNVYKSREHRLAKSVTARATRVSTIDNDGCPEFDNEPIATTQRTPVPSPDRPLSRNADTSEHSGGATEQETHTPPRGPPQLLDLHMSGSLAPLTPQTTPPHLLPNVISQQREEPQPSQPHASPDNQLPLAPRYAARLRNFQRFGGSIGPIPYVTFLRKSIHDVEFGREPHSSFYSLFQDPEKHMDDMQRLRMFVRRYLVHTSEGNNPRQVPLYAFLSVRCAWPNVDRELVNRLVPEELAALVKADRGIAEEKERKRVREDQRERQLQRYRAPAGLFSNTGILYLTQIPQRSFFTGIVTLLFSVLFAVYFGLLFGIMSDALVVSFVRMFNVFFSVSLVVWATAAIAIMLHASTGHIPLLADRFRLGFRVALTMAAIGCSIMTILVMLWKMTNQELYDLMRVHHTDQVCHFYQQHACSGFLTACDSGMIDANLCFLCPDMPMTNTSCYASLWLGVQKALVPLLCFTCIILMATLYAAYLIIKLLFFVDVMMGQIV